MRLEQSGGAKLEKDLASLDSYDVVILDDIGYVQQSREDPMTMAAAIDRLVHHAVILEMTGSSVRAEQARTRKKEDSSTTTITVVSCRRGGKGTDGGWPQVFRVRVREDQ